MRKFRAARTAVGRPLYFTCAYWVDGLMIDTGCSHTAHELVASVSNLEVHTVVNTHSHEDHVGANAALNAKFQIEIRAHSAALPILKAPRERRLRPYQRVMWGYPEACVAHPVGDTVETKRYCFQVIHTPGHSHDHICLFEPRQGWLFCGDAYVGGRDRALRRDYNIWQIISSLKKMAQLGPEILFPGSGNIKRNARGELFSKIAYLEEMGERVLDLDKKGWKFGPIRRKLFGREMPIAYITLGHFSGRNLVRSYVEDRPSS